MCGIIGSLHFRGRRDFSIRPLLDLIQHRGPDETHIIEQDFWSLGVTRLAITAPQEKNTQPLWSPDKRFCFAFNGEIYNHKEIKQEIQKSYQFKTSSDAEVLFYAYLEYGRKAFLKAQGMFACAILDSLNKTWTLVKDPFGIKPLYFIKKTDFFVFASEIKPLLKVLKNPTLNKKALPSYLQRRFVLGRETFFESVFRVLPGETLSLSSGGDMKNSKYRVLSKKPASHDTKSKRFNKFSLLLKKSIHQTAQSEKALGVLLSGGLDSSVVSCGACQALDNPPKAYFFDNGYDKQESYFAQLLSQQTGQTLHTLGPDESDFLLLPKILSTLEEPLGDSIIVPTYKLMQAVSKKTKVVLSGEGADEILAGYGHHKIFYLFHKFRFLESLKWPILLGAKLPSSLLNALFPYPTKFNKQVLSHTLTRLSQNGLNRFVELSHLFPAEEMKRLIPTITDFKQKLYPDIFSLKDLIIFDIENWLSHYNLLRLDKLSMAFSVEVRTPYLNWDFANFALGLPQTDIISLTQEKKILRRFAQEKSFKAFFQKENKKRKNSPLKLWGSPIARRKKHPFTFKETSVYSKKYRGFVRDFMDPSFKKMFDISPQELESLLQTWESGHLDNRADFRVEKQMACLLNLAVWTKEFF